MTDLPGNFSEALVKAVLETFENLAFMEPEFTPAKQFVSGKALFTTLAIRAPFKSSMQISMDEDLATLTTATIWSAQKEAVDEQMRKDTLAELLNTIAGRFMKSVLPKDQVFQLGLPKVSKGKLTAKARWKLFLFTLEGGMFQIALSLPDM